MVRVVIDETTGPEPSTIMEAIWAYHHSDDEKKTSLVGWFIINISASMLLMSCQLRQKAFNNRLQIC